MSSGPERGGADLTTALHSKFDPSPPPEGSFTATVIEGPPGSVGRAVTIDGSKMARVMIGHGSACEVALDDRAVSSRHAALEMVGRRLRITDLGSKNGTFVDSVAVVDAFLRGGENVRVGATVLRFEYRTAGARAEISTATGYGHLVGVSTEMRRLYPLCERLAQSRFPLIIEGETGTGKEVLGESLHELGPRAAGPFVVFDCTAVPPNLMEAELFGHERGAFTGAVMARKGVFEQAHGGTLFIDEIGDLEIAMQAKLLRAIERSEIRRLGGELVQVDVRIMAATRRDLDAEVQVGRFRDDLFHRLAVARIELPPLRRRRGDIPVLAAYLCEQLGGDPQLLPREIVARWEDYGWPGNVRELRNTVARHLALGELANLDPEHWSQTLRKVADAADGAEPASVDDLMEEVLRLPLGEARQRLVDEFERRYIARMLQNNGGNVTRAAESAGVARRYFQTIKARHRK
ncbi:MAG TPA: sigma 54-interacting transcriptional regulator [Polyangia bacterium]|jgi:DNA-binding NtrC family response regulator